MFDKILNETLLPKLVLHNICQACGSYKYDDAVILIIIKSVILNNTFGDIVLPNLIKNINVLLKIKILISQLLLNYGSYLLR